MLPPARGRRVEEPRLSVAAAARRFGIAPATLRTWDRRYGIGPTDHIPGRHRRYSPDDVARLELMQHALVRGASPAEAAHYAQTARLAHPDPDLPHRPRALLPAVARETTSMTAPRARPQQQAAPDEAGEPLLVGAHDPREIGAPIRVGGRVLRLPGAGQRARGLGRAALALDAGAVRAMLAESVAAAGVETAWDDVARPVLSAVAECWAYTGAGVEIEHLLSECVIGVFGVHAATAPLAADARPVLLAGMPGEQHTLPMIVLSAALADRAVPCRPLGPNLPVDALAAAVRRTAPSAVVLWSQLPGTADVEVLGAMPRTRPRFRTFAAGPGWADVALPARTGRLDSLGTATSAISAAVQI